MRKIAVFGGSQDPNIRSFCHYLAMQAIDHSPYLYAVGEPIDLSLDLNHNRLLVNGAPLESEAVFFRKDVFSYLKNKNPRLMAYSATIHDLIKQYVLYNEDIRTINRTFLRQGGTHKIFNLLKAKEIGIPIPSTLISSNLQSIRDFVSGHTEVIQKPVAGGDHAKSLSIEQLDRYSAHFPCPHKVQQRMQQPEVRVYRIGKTYLSFHMAYEGLDYRTHQAVDIALVANDNDLCRKLGMLTDSLGMDYAAADFMTNEDGTLTFLEVNSFPMFARFDKASDYAVSRALVDLLMYTNTPQCLELAESN